MDQARRVSISKYLSKHLRHQPERIGLVLGAGGWVPVDELLAAAAQHNFPITAAELAEVVASSDKQRFALDPTGGLIRANQGHSVPIDLELPALEPPELLYHGTARHVWPAIQAAGLLKMRRQHVHLSADRDTAQRVGQRHGVPMVLLVAAGELYRAGALFYRSANGVWLVEHVPPQYLVPLG